ncbi:penicillin-binding protein [Trueperella sp. LYQ143]|uniref:penicillin-binding protein n=1 Tax=Trueperella sp. LYQ143 TaxID=3391059 RepID=UPI0039835F15
MQKTGRRLTIRQLIVALLSFSLLCGVGGTLLAASAIPFTAMSGTAANAVTRMFDDLPTGIDFTRPSEQSVILAADGTKIATFYAENRIIVKSDAISPLLKDAVVSIEDERFYQHNGVDAQGIFRAAVNNFTGGALAGGSTITQQYVKNALIEQGRILGDENLIAKATEDSIARKINEARYAIAVENKLTKDEILTAYLNIAQFGPSQWGVEAASRYFFGVSAKDVSLEQAAMLAGITQSPGKWNPITDPVNAKIRRDTVLGQMYKLDKITREQFEAASAVPIEAMLHVTEVPNGCATAGISAYFCDYVVQDVLKSKSLGESSAQRIQKLYRGGLVIKTTLDLHKQQAAYDAIVASTPVNDPSSVDMALSSVEPNTGHIVAMVQNSTYGNPTEQSPNNTKLNLNAGQDMGGGFGFQSGSTFKIFTLMEWLHQGRNVNEVINTDIRTFPANTWKIRCAPSVADVFNPSNLEGAGGGRMTVLESTRKSVNTAFAVMANQYDLCDIVDRASALGVRRGTLAQEGSSQTAEILNAGLHAEYGKPLPLLPNPGSILGTNPVTPLSMANAMASLAAEGKYCEPTSFTQITDNNGTILAAVEPQCRQAVDAELARQTTAVLQQVLTRGATGENAILAGGRPAAGKTGTADLDYHAWFVGYTPQLATAVWQGHYEGSISMFDSVINGTFHSEVYGGLYPARSFKQYMDNALANTPIQQFNKPAKDPLRGANRPPADANKNQDQDKDKDKNKDKENNDSNASAPNLIGMSQEDAQNTALAAGFGYTTRAKDSNQPAGTVVAQSPAAGEKAEPGIRIDIWVSNGRG